MYGVTTKITENAAETQHQNDPTVSPAYNKHRRNDIIKIALMVMA